MNLWAKTALKVADIADFDIYSAKALHLELNYLSDLLGSSI
jgi:hypothetical protein